MSDEVAIATTRAPERDIYFLNFDRYGSDWSLKEAYGIENDLYPDLEAMGFQVIPGARANYHTSDLSLASTLNMRYLDELTETVGRDSGYRTPARELLARHEVGTFLRQQGYRFYHIGAWWEPTRAAPSRTRSWRWARRRSSSRCCARPASSPRWNSWLARPSGHAFARPTPRPGPLRLPPGATARTGHRAAHSSSPTSSCRTRRTCLPRAGGPCATRRPRQGRRRSCCRPQVDFTDDRIRETVDALLAGPDDEDPIIIITADEGPYLCYEVDCVDGSAEQYGIRFGVLRAYYLPGLDVTVPADDSGVNIFRMILREYFGMDLPDLPNRSYAWVDKEHRRLTYTFRDAHGSDPASMAGG